MNPPPHQLARRGSPIRPSKLCRKKSIKRDPPLLFQKAATSRTSRVCLYIARGQVSPLHMRNNGHSFPPSSPSLYFPPAPPTSEKEEEERRRRLVLDRPIVLFLLLPSPLSSCEWRGRPGPNRRRYGPQVSGKLSPRKMRWKKEPIFRRRGFFCCLDEIFSTQKVSFPKPE